MVGNPNVVSDEGTDENGDTGAPDGANTGFDAVVREAGAEAGSLICAFRSVLTAMVTKSDKSGIFEPKATMMEQRLVP